jgi:thiol-disulfide isomerase/thioredoxin
MDKKKNLLILVAALVLLIAGASVLYKQLGAELAPEQMAAAETTPPEETGTQPSAVPAPDVTVYDREGNPVKLSDYFGKPIVMNFWASWCGPCKMEMPDFNEKYLEMGEEIHFLMINMTDGYRETVDIASAFIQAQGYTFPVYYDTAGNASMTYGVYSLPTTFFIDAEGHAIAQAVGAIDAETLQRGIDMIVNK